MALTLSGTTAYISVPNNLATYLGGTSTLTCWFSTTQTGTTFHYTSPGITGVEQNFNINDIFWGWIDNNGYMGIQAGNSTPAKSSSPINDNVLHFVAMQRNSVNGNVRISIDGSSWNTQTGGDTGLKTTTFSSFGRIESTILLHKYFLGTLADLRIYNVLLNINSIQTIYNAKGVDNIVYGLKHRWPMISEFPQLATASGSGSIKDIVGLNNGTPTSLLSTITYTQDFLKLRRIV